MVGVASDLNPQVRGGFLSFEVYHEAPARRVGGSAFRYADLGHDLAAETGVELLLDDLRQIAKFRRPRVARDVDDEGRTFQSAGLGVHRKLRTDHRSPDLPEPRLRPQSL